MVFFTFILSLVLGHSAPTPNFVTVPAKSGTVASSNTTARSEQLAWSTDRRLSWNDFKATPDSLNEHHAMTAANLAVDAKCNGNKINFTVRCVFLPTQSWSKNKRSEKLLHHEQLHFDLTEVHARLLRKKLLSLGTSCSNAQHNLNETVSAAFAEWKAEQRNFDKLSNHGLDSEATKAWASNINSRLKQLERYK